MSYKSSTQLTGSVKLTGHKLHDGVISMVSTSGTPYTQVTRLTQDSGSGTDTMTFSAWGSGFVSGHVLVCNVICRVEDA